VTLKRRVWRSVIIVSILGRSSVRSRSDRVRGFVTRLVRADFSLEQCPTPSALLPSLPLDHLALLLSLLPHPLVEHDEAADQTEDAKVCRPAAVLRVSPWFLVMARKVPVYRAVLVEPVCVTRAVAVARTTTLRPTVLFRATTADFDTRPVAGLNDRVTR